jgi:glycerate kinase
MQIRAEQVDPRLKNTEIWVACDVDNPLLGPQGAAHVYGPQKGATPDMVETLDSNLAHFHQVVKNVLHMDVAEQPGSGAAGGLGAGLMVFAGGRFVSGVELLMDMVGFEQALSQADWLCTGEGKLDLQTLRGKVVAGMVKEAVALGVPTFIFTGELAGDTRWANEELVVPFCIAEGPMERKMMMEDASRLLCRTAARVFRTVHIAARRMRADD